MRDLFESFAGMRTCTQCNVLSSGTYKHLLFRRVGKGIAQSTAPMT